MFRSLGILACWLALAAQVVLGIAPANAAVFCIHPGRGHEKVACQDHQCADRAGGWHARLVGHQHAAASHDSDHDQGCACIDIPLTDPASRPSFQGPELATVTAPPPVGVISTFDRCESGPPNKASLDPPRPRAGLDSIKTTRLRL